MKKILLSFILLLVFFVNLNVFAKEIILYSSDGFDIKTENYVQDKDGYIYVVKNSVLNISYTNKSNIDFQESEPKIDLSVYKKDTKELVYSIKSPTTRSNPNKPDFEDYFLKNIDYFDNVSMTESKIDIKLPLKIDPGQYDIDLNITRDNEKNNLKTSFRLSNSYYNFTDFDIIIEDNDVLANIGYMSFMEIEQTNKISVSLTKNNQEVFKKEFDKVFYKEGNILIDENIDILSKLDGLIDLKIEVKNPEGEVILSQIKAIEIKKHNTFIKYIISIVFILILFIIIFFFIKKRTRKNLLMSFVLFLTFFSVNIFSNNVSSEGVCDLASKPADVCIDGQMMTQVCLQEEECKDGADIKYRRHFFTESANRNLINIDERDSSITLNICNYYKNIFGNVILQNGTSFYIVSDSLNSSWSKKRFHVFNLVRGTAATVEFDPGGNKRNTNKAVYDGNCTVTISSKYKGSSSSQQGERVAVLETGFITSSMCKARFVNADNYNNNGNLLTRPYCDFDYGNRDTYIQGSVYIDPQRVDQSIRRSSWQNKTVNICTLMGIESSEIPTLKSQNKKFYTLFNQYSSWTKISYPVFEFSYGVSKPVPTSDNFLYILRDSKENWPTVSYDGSCNVTFKLTNRGDDTDQWQPGFDLIELGDVSNATCKDPILTRSSSYRNTSFENTVKTVRYPNIAPFFMPLSACQGSLSVCQLQGTWIDSYTEEVCDANDLSVTVDNISTSSARINWEYINPKPQTNYQVEVSTDDNFTNIIQNKTGAPIVTLNVFEKLVGTKIANASTDVASVRNVSVTGLQPNTEYFIRLRVQNSDGWGDYVEESFSTEGIIERNCTCEDRTLKCSLGDIEEDPIENSPFCSLQVSCLVATTTTQNIYTLIPRNVVDNVEYNIFSEEGDILSTATRQGNISYVYESLKSENVSSIIAEITDSFDNAMDSVECGVLGEEEDENTASLSMSKSPLTALNKGGSCTIYWDIQNMPETATCVLTGTNSSSQTVTAKNSRTFGPLTENQKYTITCSDESFDQPIVRSELCRINPSAREN